MANKNAGRPTVLTPEVVSILVGSFQNGMTVREACWQSGISHETYYSRVRDDDEFADTMAKAQASSTLAARKVVIDAINGGDVSTAKWWLERKASNEFGRVVKADEPEHVESKENRFANMSDEEFDRITEDLFHSLNLKNHIKSSD